MSALFSALGCPHKNLVALADGRGNLQTRGGYEGEQVAARCWECDSLLWAPGNDRRVMPDLASLTTIEGDE